jgi:hypothetical protein
VSRSSPDGPALLSHVVDGVFLHHLALPLVWATPLLDSEETVFEARVPLWISNAHHHLSLRAGRNACGAMYEALSGLVPGVVEDAHCLEAVSEAVNLVAGHLVGTLSETGPMAQLGTPETGPFPPTESPPLAVALRYLGRSALRWEWTCG